MSLATLREIIRARKLTFLSVFVLIVGATAVFCFLATPIYRSEALVMISQGQTHKQQMQFPDTLRFQLNSQIYVIQSDDVLRQAIATITPQALFPDRSRSLLAELRDRLSESAWADQLGFAHSDAGRSDIDDAL